MATLSLGPPCPHCPPPSKMPPPRPTTRLGEYTRMEDNKASWRRTCGELEGERGDIQAQHMARKWRGLARNAKWTERCRRLPGACWLVRCGGGIRNRGRGTGMGAKTPKQDGQFEQCNKGMPWANGHTDRKHLDIDLWIATRNPMSKKALCKIPRVYFICKNQMPCYLSYTMYLHSDTCIERH